MDNGWIKIHRQLFQKAYYTKSEYVHLWIHILMKANHKPNKWLYKNETMKVNSGQFITSRKSLSEETGINGSKVERILKCFEIEQQIEQQNLFVNRLITIVNYDHFQKVNSKVNSKRTASEQQVNTNKNDKNEKKDIKHAFFVFSKQHPDATETVQHFLSTLAKDELRFKPKTVSQKMKWLKCAEWAIRQMGEHGKEKVKDIISVFRNPDDEVSENWAGWPNQFKTILKLQKKNKEGIYYLDIFWDKLNGRWSHGG